MKLLNVFLSVLAASLSALEARADQVWGSCTFSSTAGPGTQGPYYAYEEYHDGFQEYISHSNWHVLTLLPAQTGTLRVQPTSVSGVYQMNVFMSGSCPTLTAAGSPLSPTTWTPVNNPGWTVTNSSTSPRAYYLQVWPWTSGSIGSVNYNLEVQITSPSIGGSYCPGAPNSVGSGATLVANGTPSIGANNLTFTGALMPAGGIALLAGGSISTSPLAFGDGTLCIGGSIQRLRIAPVSSAGTWTSVLNFLNLPPGVSIGPGNTFLQLWYRDSAGPLGTGFNLSNGLIVTFIP